MTTSDPIYKLTQLPVQLNFQVPWQIREDLNTLAREQGTSLADVARRGLMKGLEDEFERLTKQRTIDAGATK